MSAKESQTLTSVALYVRAALTSLRMRDEAKKAVAL